MMLSDLRERSLIDCGPSKPPENWCCRSRLEGSSLRRRETLRLNGDESASFWKELKEPCLSRISAEALGRETA